jgi:tetratricopeptide (TPR) repeat protein
MYHPTRNETLFGIGIVFKFLSILTFYNPMDHSWRWVGDVIIYVSSTMGLSQYFICLLIALFFFGFVIYSKLRSKHSEKLLIILSTAFMLGIFSLIFSFIISYGTGPNSIFLKKDQFTVTELIEMGDILLSYDNYKEAISYYDRALNLEPNNGEALYQKRIALHYLDHQSFHKLE